MTNAELERALGAAGIPCRVEARERMVVLRPADGTDVAPALASPAGRRRVIALAREHGFSHVALEISEGDGEALPRGKP